MNLDVILLSRIQFALTIMFHYLFPPLTIGMGVVLVYLEGMFLKTREPIYETAAKFWTQLFAVTFAVGVATGIVMEFQFGTNWAVYSRFVGDVFGSALAAEGIFAFFLESGFLSILVFGWNRVGPVFHFIATILVSLGSMFSAIWIIVANSWQQTPAGHHIVEMTRNGEPWIVNGKIMMRAEIVDFWAVVFNPSTVNRLTHTLIGAFITGAFFIMSISAYYILRGRHVEFAKRSFTGALIFGTIFSITQAFSGHSNARMVAKHQPAKMAAMEAQFVTGPADLTLVGWPDEETEKVHFNVAIPKFLSFLIHGDFEAPVLGLDRFKREHWPPLLVTFLSYHLMVGFGVFFILLTLTAAFLRWRGTLFKKRKLLWVFVSSIVWVTAANQLGWIAAEVGRQPWTVHPTILRSESGDPLLDENGKVRYRMEEALQTKDAVSERTTAPEVLASMIMFGAIYSLLGALWVFVLDRKIRKGPDDLAPAVRTTQEGIREALAERSEG